MLQPRGRPSVPLDVLRVLSGRTVFDVAPSLETLVRAASCIAAVYDQR